MIDGFIGLRIVLDFILMWGLNCELFVPLDWQKGY
jgi:hypothetical protein